MKFGLRDDSENYQDTELNRLATQEKSYQANQCSWKLLYVGSYGKEPENGKAKIQLERGVDKRHDINEDK